MKQLGIEAQSAAPRADALTLRLQEDVNGMAVLSLCMQCAQANADHCPKAQLLLTVEAAVLAVAAEVVLVTWSRPMKSKSGQLTGLSHIPLLITVVIIRDNEAVTSIYSAIMIF